MVDGPVPVATQLLGENVADLSTSAVDINGAGGGIPADLRYSLSRIEAIPEAMGADSCNTGMPSRRENAKGAGGRGTRIGHDWLVRFLFCRITVNARKHVRF